MFLPVLAAGMMSLTLTQIQPTIIPLSEGLQRVPSSTVRERIQVRMDNFQQRWEDASEQRQEKLEAMRERLKIRLQTVREASKQDTASRLADRLNAVNDTHADNELRFLNTLENILAKIESRAANLTGDTSAVTDAIAKAKNAIAKAKESVLAQKAKVYGLVANSTEPIGQSFRAIVKQMNQDHQALRNDVLKPAKEAVRETLSVLKTAAGQQKPDKDSSRDASEENEE